MMKIALLTTGTEINGAIRHCYDLAQELAKIGHEVFLLHRPGAWIAAQPQHGNITLFESPLKRKKRELGRVAQFLRGKGCGVVHTHLSGASFFGVLLARLYGFRSVATCHMPHFQPHWWWNDHVIVPCNSVARFQRFMNWVPRKRMSIIPNFINPDRLSCSVSRVQAREQLGVSQSSFLIGTIGTLEARKGFQYLAQAVTKLRYAGEDVQLLSVGPQEDSYANIIRQFIDEQSMTEHIKLLGRRTDIPEILRAMDCACLPSLREVMPISLLEAMGAGVPALATNVGGVPDCIRSDIDGMLVPPKNADALMRVIKSWIDEPDKVQRLGKQAQQSMRERFGPAVLVPRIVEVYQRFMPK
ncbi:MAG: glycosyltransferase family 4 protein [Pirellula sp.]|jgi:glycosyltransferase involved in cell wall biosynthesis